MSVPVVDSAGGTTTAAAGGVAVAGPGAVREAAAGWAECAPGRGGEVSVRGVAAFVGDNALAIGGLFASGCAGARASALAASPGDEDGFSNAL